MTGTIRHTSITLIIVIMVTLTALAIANTVNLAAVSTTTVLTYIIKLNHKLFLSLPFA